MTPDPTLGMPRARPRRRRFPVLTAVAFFVLSIVILFAVLGAVITPHDPFAQDPLNSVALPSDDHFLGTDQLGRDVFSLLIAAARTAIMGPIGVALLCAAIGGTLGLSAAYHGGLLDGVVNRFADLVYALPALLIAIVVIGVVEGGYWLTAAVLTLLLLPYQIRMTRSAATVQMRLPYVDAARTLGISALRTMFRHILPNILPTVVAACLLDFVTALIGYAALSYLGLGVAAGRPDWGAMLNEGQSFIVQNPWLPLAPAIMLIMTAASVTLVGDWVYDRLSLQREDR